VPRAANAEDKSARKNLQAKIQRNPLISLDSDERIQGNQNKSNGHKVGFRCEMAASQEKPNERPADIIAPLPSSGQAHIKPLQ
jgi:hypothetical protein